MLRTERQDFRTGNTVLLGMNSRCGINYAEKLRDSHSKKLRDRLTERGTGQKQRDILTELGTC